MQKTTKMNSTYYFSRTKTSFIDVQIIIHYALRWFTGGVFTYVFIIHPNVLFALGAVFFFLNPFEYEYLKYRKLIFRLEENTTLTIDTLQKEFSYTHENSNITFKSEDVDKWYWREYGTIDILTTFVEIVEIRLTNGKKIIISNAIGDVREFFCQNWKELELPKGQKMLKSESSYMKEVIIWYQSQNTDL